MNLGFTRVDPCFGRPICYPSEIATSMRQKSKAEIALLGAAVLLGLSAVSPAFAWTSGLTTTVLCLNTGTGTWAPCPSTIPAGTSIKDSATLTGTVEPNCGPHAPSGNCGTISFRIVTGAVPTSGCPSSVPTGATAEGTATVPTSFATTGHAGPFYSSSPSLGAGTYYFYVVYSGTGLGGYPAVHKCEPFTGGSFPPPPPPGVPQFPLGLAALLAAAVPALLLLRSKRSAILNK